MKTHSSITSVSPAIFCAVKIFCTNYIYDSNVSPVTEPDSSVSDIVESVYGLWDELYGTNDYTDNAKFIFFTVYHGN